jgi:hypothetical protein
MKEVRGLMTICGSQASHGFIIVQDGRGGESWISSLFWDILNYASFFLSLLLLTLRYCTFILVVLILKRYIGGVWGILNGGIDG